MSVSGIRVAESNRDKARLRATGSQQVNAEELLAELVRLVESSALAPGQTQPPAQSAPEPKGTDEGPKHPLEMMSRHKSVDALRGRPSETGAVNVEPPRAPESGDSYTGGPYGIDLATGRRSGAWLLGVSALVLAGAAAIGSFFWFKPDEPGLPKAPAFIATTPTVQPKSDLTVATPSDAGAAPVGGLPQPAPVKTVSSGERPTDLNARASLNDAPPPAGLGPTATGAAQTAADASAGNPLAAPVNTPTAAAQNAASPPMAWQAPDAEAAPTGLPATDPPQIATPTPSATASGRAAHASDAPLPPVRRAKKAASEATGVLHRSTPTPARLSGESAAHVGVAKAETTAAGAPVETPSESLRRGAPVKPAKGASPVNAAEAPAEAQAAQPEPPLPAQQPNPNPVVHAFSSMVGALNGLNPFATH